MRGFGVQEKHDMLTQVITDEALIKKAVEKHGWEINYGPAGTVYIEPEKKSQWFYFYCDHIQCSPQMRNRMLQYVNPELAKIEGITPYKLTPEEQYEYDQI